MYEPRMSNMPEKSEKEILNSIWRALEEIKAVLVLSNQEKLTEVKKGLLKEGSIKLQIYNLCDGTKTIQEIAQSIQKSTDYVSSYLSILRREGLVRITDKEGKQIHEQIF
jgi:DNA-binding transcriptional ArsR family regulator